MSQLNRRIRASTVVNHEGLKVKESDPKAQLSRMVLANMLWEDQFYMDGQSSVDIISSLVPVAGKDFVNELSLKARSEFNLRHVPLLLQRTLAKHSMLSADVLAEVIQRPDEMGEFLSLYWKDGKQPLSNQVKKGLAKAFCKFNEYQLAKWDKNSAQISVRDVMFLTHPRPQTLGAEELFKRVANQELKTPDTWETQLSAGADKRETFMRLMSEKKLGALAFLRNLRNMLEAGVPVTAIEAYGATVNTDRVLPFRFIAAARVVPSMKPMLEQMMLRSVKEHKKLPGKTVLLVDVSGSMFGAKISDKSDLERFDAAAALAMLCREVCEEVEIYSFSNRTVRIQNNIRGFALVDALHSSQLHQGTDLASAVKSVNERKYTRCIVFTDEQSFSRPDAPKGIGYVVNVAGYQHGINHKDWIEINGFSEAVIDYIQASE